MPYIDPTPRVEAIKQMLVSFGVADGDIYYPEQSFEGSETDFPSYTIVTAPTEFVPVGPQFSVEQNTVEVQIRLVAGTTVGAAEIAARTLLKQFVNAGPGVPIRHAMYEEAMIPELSDDLQTTDITLVLECGLEPGE